MLKNLHGYSLISLEDASRVIAHLFVEIGDAELLDFSLWILKNVIESTPNSGLPLGNQTSSPLALALS